MQIICKFLPFNWNQEPAALTNMKQENFDQIHVDNNSSQAEKWGCIDRKKRNTV